MSSIYNRYMKRVRCVYDIFISYRGFLCNCFSCFINARISATSLLYPQCIYMIYIIFTLSLTLRLDSDIFMGGGVEESHQWSAIFEKCDWVVMVMVVVMGVMMPLVKNKGKGKSFCIFVYFSHPLLLPKVNVEKLPNPDLSEHT